MWYNIPVLLSIVVLCVTPGIASSQTTTLVSDDFSRPNGAVIGNGWREVEHADTAVSINDNQLLFEQSADVAMRPIASRNYTPVNSGIVEWQFESNWVRTGREKVYSVFMQLGDGSQMSDTSNDAGVAINLQWSLIGGVHETLGVRNNGTASALQVVSGPATIRVRVDLDQGIFAVYINGQLVQSQLPFDDTVIFNTVRYFTHSLNESNFSGRSFDAVSIVNNVTDPQPGNTAPEANADTYQLDQDKTLSVAGPGVLSNDVDDDGDTLSTQLINSTNNGTLVLSPDGAFTYQPDSGFSGNDSFSYVANDGELNSNPATVTIQVDPVDPTDPPTNVLLLSDDFERPNSNVVGNGWREVEHADTAMGINDNQLFFERSADVAIRPIATRAFTPVSAGIVEWQFESNWVRTGREKVYSVFMQLGDGSQMSDTSIDAGVAINLQWSLIGGVHETLGVRNNGTASALQIVSGPATIRVRADLDQDTFAVYINEQLVQSQLPFDDIATLNTIRFFTHSLNESNFAGRSFDAITLTANPGDPMPGNTAPVANADTYQLDQDKTLSVSAPGVLGNDSDSDGDTLTAVLLDTTESGNLTLNADGSFVYQPNPGFAGNDSFTYKARDNDLDSAPTVVTIDVAPLIPVNTAPVVQDENYSVDQDQLLSISAPGVLDNDTDLDGDALNAVVIGSTSNGSLILSPDGAFTYRPDTGFSGNDSFSYVANDGELNSNPATVTIQVDPVDPTDPPTNVLLLSDDFERPDNTTVGNDWREVEDIGTAVGVNNNQLFFVESADIAIRPLVSRNFTSVNSGIVEWQFESNWVRTGREKVYSVFMQLGDGSQMSDTSIDAGVAINLQWSLIGGVHETLGVRNNGTASALRVVSGPATIRVRADLDQDTFAVYINEQLVQSQLPFDDIATLNTIRFFTHSLNESNFAGRSFDAITLTANPEDPMPGNTAPKANANTYQLDQNQTLKVAAPGVLSNDVDDDSDTLSAFLMVSSDNGTLILSPDGSFTYQPESGYSGIDSFSYVANDGELNSSPATVTIQVDPVEPTNTAPKSNTDRYSMPSGTSLTIDAPGVLSNDTDAEMDTLSAILINTTGDGSLIFNNDGSFSYTPEVGFSGNDAFTYRATDGELNSEITLVTISVEDTGVSNSIPFALDQTLRAADGVPLNIELDFFDLDELDDHEFTIVQFPEHGALSAIDGDELFSYAADVGYTGSDSFTFQVSDGKDVSNIATVSLQIQHFPAQNWESRTPAQVGLDAQILQQFVDSVGGRGTIIKNGYVVKSWGDQALKSDWASAAKPMNGTLLFFAMQEGLVNSPDDLVKDLVLDALGNPLNAEDQSITFSHLANMISGYARAEAPGEAFSYNDIAIRLYGIVLTEVFSTSLNEAAISRLTPLQLQDGSLYTSRDNLGITTSVRDFARLGWLWLNRGNWNGQQLISEAFFDDYMQVQVEGSLPLSQLEDTDYLGIGTFGGGTNQQPYGPGIYGMNWWFNETVGTLPVLAWPDAPTDTVQANGHWGREMVVFIPSLNMVVSSIGDWGSFEPGNPQSGINENLQLLVEANDAL